MVGAFVILASNLIESINIYNGFSSEQNHYIFVLSG